MVNELLLPQPRLFLLGAGVVLAVTTRFEAVLYVGLLALSVASVPGRRAFWGIVITCLGTVLLLSSWRLAVFSDLLPNTFWAKRWPPYAAFGLREPAAGRAGIAKPLHRAGDRARDLAALRLRSRGRAADTSPCPSDPRLSDPGSHSDGRSDRKALGLLRAHAVLRVPARVALVFGGAVVMGERPAQHLPGRQLPPACTWPRSACPWRAFPRARWAPHSRAARSA